MAKHNLYGDKSASPSTQVPQGIQRQDVKEEVYPGAAKLTFCTYEKQVTARLERETKLIDSRVKSNSRSQVAFILAAGGLVLALAFALLGNNGAALASIIGGIAPIILEDLY